jgi:AraC family transcriptional regulator
MTHATDPTNARSLASAHPRACALTAPLAYLSSADAGWEELEAEAFVEPNELEGWFTPVLPAVSLVFFRGGGMRLEARYANGPWSTTYRHDGCASLRAAWGPPQELRWRATSAAPTSTLHVRLSQALLLRAAEQIGGYDPAELTTLGIDSLNDPLLCGVGRALWRELETPSPAGALYASTAAHFLAAHLLRHYSSLGGAIREPPPGRLSSRQTQRVVDFIHAHLTQDLSLDLLAQHSGFSAYHFARLFRRTVGESPHQYVLRLRVERARALLQQADLPLVAVAMAAGFAHQSHLTQQFKRHLGVTPSVYRREHAPRAGGASADRSA